jgi:hypothetical protein
MNKTNTVLASISLMAMCLFVPYSSAQTYEDLVKTIRKNHVHSISELLPLLPEDYRREFTLVMQSRSLQGATAANPRVIMSGTSGQLVIAFNGSPEQTGYDKLELFQFRPATASFDFFEIQFPEKNAQGEPLNALTEPKFSDANPARCLFCHTSDPRPNWESYPRWPGVFMGDDDKGNLESDLPRLSDYLKVIANDYPKHDRYKYLVDAYKSYSKQGGAEDNSFPRTFTEHNINLTQRLGMMNFQRVTRLLKTDPYYQSYKYLLAGTVGCGDDNMSAFTPGGFPLLTARKDEFGERDFLSVYEKRGLFIGDFYGNFRSMTPYFTTPGNSSPELLGALASNDPDLGNQIMVGEESNYGVSYKTGSAKNCAALAELSRRALEKTPAPDEEIADRQAHTPAILQKCMSCHTSLGLPAPHVPFDNVGRLQAHLARKGYRRGTFRDELLYRVSVTTPAGERMPPTGMTDQERTELVDYIRKL